MKSFLFGSLLAASLFAACNVPIGAALRPYRYVSAEPNRAEIVGVWTPDPATVEDLRGRGGYDASVPVRLTLREDGTFELANMPDWWDNGFGKSYKGFSSASGRWELTNGSGGWGVSLKYSGASRSAGLVEHKFRDSPRYYMEFILGDPDSGDAMIFARKE